MKIGIISSSGGSAWNEINKISSTIWPDLEYQIITDRQCGIEKLAQKNNIKYYRILEPDNKKFSLSVKKILHTNKIDYVFLFFTRLIDKTLFLKYPTINFHESLLPSFTGFKALNKAKKTKVKFFGTTAHLIDEKVDHGHILSQSISPINKYTTLKDMEKASFIHKIYIALSIIEGIKNKDLIIKPQKIIWNNTSNSNQFNPTIKSIQIKKQIENLIYSNKIQNLINIDQL